MVVPETAVALASNSTTTLDTLVHAVGVNVPQVASKTTLRGGGRGPERVREDQRERESERERERERVTDRRTYEKDREKSVKCHGESDITSTAQLRLRLRFQYEK